LNLVITW